MTGRWTERIAGLATRRTRVTPDQYVRPAGQGVERGAEPGADELARLRHDVLVHARRSSEADDERARLDLAYTELHDAYARVNAARHAAEDRARTSQDELERLTEALRSTEDRLQVTHIELHDARDRLAAVTAELVKAVERNQSLAYELTAARTHIAAKADQS